MTACWCKSSMSSTGAGTGAGIGWFDFDCVVQVRFDEHVVSHIFVIKLELELERFMAVELVEQN